MPQTLLPIFPEDVTPITELLSFTKRDGSVYYFHGCYPIFCHTENDLRSFRMFTSQLVVNGSCRQIDIIRAFGISSISMKRYVKKYREGGVEAFFKTRKKARPRVLTEEVVKHAQDMLNEGHHRSEVATKLKIKRDTLYKAIRSGHLIEPKKNNPTEKQRVPEA